jgi:membrane-associated phospholipid phosphatase
MSRTHAWTRGPTRRLGLRLTLAAVAVVLVAVPFTGLLALVDTRWEPLRHLDLSTTTRLNAYVLHHRELVSPLRATSYIFHAWVFRLVVAVLVVWLLRRGARRLALWAVTTMVVAGLLDGAHKLIIHRPRPSLPSAIAHAPGGSFPSGHALTAAAAGAVIVLVLLPVLRGAWCVVAWAAAVLVSLMSGACRVALGVHYVSDVLAGWVLGAAIVLATAAAFETWRRDEGRRPAAPLTEGLEPGLR